VYLRFERNLSILQRSPRTIENYGRHIAAIALYFGLTPLELDAEQVQNYLYRMQQRSKTPSLTYFKHTVFGLRFLLKSEGLAYEHLLLPPIKHDKKLPVVLSKQEVWSMLCCCKMLKHKILISLLYGCGLRLEEALNVRLRDLDFDRKQLHVVQGKGKKDRYVPLSEHLIRGITSYLAEEKPKEWLFNGLPVIHQGVASHTRYSKKGAQTAVKQAVISAGIIKDAHVHTLRHSYATHLLEDGLDIVTLKNLLGHSKIETTMEYLHVAQLQRERAFSPLDTLFSQCAPKSK
jgi:Site-specific recombinase XerD